MCGLKGYHNKCERRKQEGKGFYRKAKQTISSRVRKNLLERTSWFKGKKPDGVELPYKKDYIGSRDKQGKGPVGDRNKVKSVIFVPQTHNSELTQKMREGDDLLEKTKGYKMKIVERAGDSLEGLLHKSNPWSGADCAREKCLLCETKTSNPKIENQSCTRRNVVYETWCETCRKEEAEKQEESMRG